MDRRNFLKTIGAAVLLSGVTANSAHAFVTAHNWDKHDFDMEILCIRLY